MTTQRAMLCKQFLLSPEFAEYVEDFPLPYERATKRGRLDPLDRTKWPDDWNTLGKFCQDFWELLPDRADIRQGAFFRLCIFAESWVFEPRSKSL
jgi:hypothetical protein